MRPRVSKWGAAGEASGEDGRSGLGLAMSITLCREEEQLRFRKRERS
jgi:hypothetical protein